MVERLGLAEYLTHPDDHVAAEAAAERVAHFHGDDLGRRGYPGESAGRQHRHRGAVAHDPKVVGWGVAGGDRVEAEVEADPARQLTVVAHPAVEDGDQGASPIAAAGVGRWRSYRGQVIDLIEVVVGFGIDEQGSTPGLSCSSASSCSSACPSGVPPTSISASCPLQGPEVAPSGMGSPSRTKPRFSRRALRSTRSAPAVSSSKLHDKISNLCVV